MKRKNTGIAILGDPNLLFPTPFVLSDRGIRRNIRTGKISINDFNDKQVQPVSLDLRIGDASVYDGRAMALLEKERRGLNFRDQLEFEPHDGYAKKYLRGGKQAIDVPPRGLVEITIHEDVKTSFLKRVDLRSSRGRLGLQIESFDGRVLGIRNYNPNTIRLHGGTPFAQMFFHTRTPVDGRIIRDPMEAKELGRKLGIPTLGPYLMFQLGEHAFKYRNVGLIDTDKPSKDLYEKVKLQDLFVPVGETIVAQLQPRINLPSNLAIQLINVPYVQTGCNFGPNPEMFFCEPNRSNAGLVDPGYEGNVTAHLRRTKTSAIYNQGENIIFGVMTKFKESVERPYGSEGLGSHYQGSKGSVSKS